MLVNLDTYEFYKRVLDIKDQIVVKFNISAYQQITINTLGCLQQNESKINSVILLLEN